MSPIIVPLPARRLSEEEFYALGAETPRNRISAIRASLTTAVQRMIAPKTTGRTCNDPPRQRRVVTA